MSIAERAEKADEGLKDLPTLHRIKHRLDRLLPVALVLIFVYLYLAFLASSAHPLYPYREPLQFAILGYFLAELGVDFLIYEEHSAFFRERWLDIVLTLPFFTAFKGVNAALRATTGLKLLKTTKAAKAGKAAKVGKAGKAGKAARAGRVVKTGQKVGKLTTKGKKLAKKKLKQWT